jgi:hypothetical protein
MLEPMTGNVIMSKADALMYVILSNAGKYVPYGELVGTTECITLCVAQTEVILTEFNCICLPSKLNMRCLNWSDISNRTVHSEVYLALQVGKFTYFKMKTKVVYYSVKKYIYS